MHVDYTVAQFHLWSHSAMKKTLEIFLEKRAFEYPRSIQIGEPMKALNTFLGCFLLIILLSGCSARQSTEPLPDTIPVSERQAPPKEDFIPGFNPFKDDPDNPSPHNPLVRKFGDISEVRTYIRLKQKFLSGIGLNIDEAIELYTAEAHLYPSDATKANLKRWKKDKERYERLGIRMDGPVLRYNVKTDANDVDAAGNKAED